MNLAQTNPLLTPHKRGTGQLVRLPSWEGLGVGHGPNAGSRNVELLHFATRSWKIKIKIKSKSVSE